MQCPYCNNEFAKLPLHVCPQEPMIRQRMILALSDGSGRAIGSSDYAIVQAGTGLPSPPTLRKYFGTWENICAYYGLQSRGVSRHERSIKRKAAQRAKKWQCTYDKPFTMHLRMTEAQRELVQTMAEAWDATMSEVVRRAIDIAFGNGVQP